MEARGNGFGYLLLGLGVGTVVGMLLAPKSGVETRKFLLAKTGDGANYLKQQGQAVVDSANETIERSKQTLRNQGTKLSDAVAAGKQAYREAVETTPLA